MTDTKTTSHNRNVRDRVAATQLRVLDGLDALLDRMTPPKSPAAAMTVTRRQAANVLRLWKFCDRSRCRRGQCCRGEPLDCMRIGATVLPPEAFEPWLQRGKGGARRARSKARSAPSEQQAAP